MLPSDQPRSPRTQAGFLSCLLFGWVIPLFKQGYQKDLTLEDIYRVIPEDETKHLTDRLEAAWLEQVRKAEEKATSKAYEPGTEPQPSLIRACSKVYAPIMFLYGACAVFEECVIKIGQPILLGYLLDYFNDPSEFEPYEGYMLALGVIGCSIIYSTTDHPFTFAVQHLGMKLRISLCSLVYRKTLKVSKYALEQTTAGQIVNFLSSDMNRFDIFFTFIHYLWVAPLQLTIVLVLLYTHVDLDYSSFTALFLVVLFVPFQGYMGRMFSKLRTKTANKTDQRLLVLEEILSAMRVIKMYTWEAPFSETVTETRKAEIRMIKKTSLSKAVNNSCFSVTSRTTLFITLLSYVMTGHVLTAKKVYITFSLYQSIQYVMMLFFPWAVLSLAETLVALKRIRAFLLLEERNVPPLAASLLRTNRIRRYEMEADDSVSESSSVYTSTTYPFEGAIKPEDIGVSTKEITATWNPHKDSKDIAFSNVSFHVKLGEIIALIGPTASGKSSILHSLLYELPIKNGDFKVVGSVAYSSQEPWVFHGSVRDNILFGKPYKSSWYDVVTEACCLAKDFHLLPYGDHTLVGEKGTALSGGLKARVTLARAVYADADVYLLDDPLSAVDAQVSRHIVDNCILGLLKNKCRVLITNQIQYLKSMDQIILLDHGIVAHKGDFKSLQKSGVPFTNLFNSNFDITSRKTIEGGSGTSHFTRDSVSSIMLADKAPLMDAAPVKVGGTVLEGPEEEEEYTGSGSVSYKTYWYYFSAGSGMCILLLLVIMTLCTQLLFTSVDLWLQFWVETERHIGENTLVLSTHPIVHYIQRHTLIRIGIYTLLIVVLFIMFLARSQLFYRQCMKSNIVIYDRLFYGILRSPMIFFETTPIGRILNRFAKDISVIDENLPQTLYDCLEIGMQTLGVFAVVGLNSPIMLVPSLVLVLIFAGLRRFYFRTARSIKRLEGIARSPIFSHLTATIRGLSIIRSYGLEQKFIREFEILHDVHNSVWYMFLACARWLGIVVDWIAAIYISCVALNFLIDVDMGIVFGPAVVGVSITSAMALTSMCQWGMRQSAEMENHMVAVERVMEYCNLEPEAALESYPDKKPPPDWPDAGEIKIRNLCLRYREDSPVMVLKNITCTIEAGEKIGIVGRTGAGKTSVINVLFRLSEPTSGYIEIDGIVTSCIGLHDLRSKISIIPQEPVIFMGTVRGNLDPLRQHHDDRIWDALKEVKLAHTIREMDGGLYTVISEGGANFSSGQKQLLCLARCILTSNRILVLDEATANIDPETDRLIQRTIRRNFRDCTVITIAHRLHTVMDSDRILVLKAGQIMEFDEPEALLSNRHSILYLLVQQTGKAEASNLLHIAKIAALRRRQFGDNVSLASRKSSTSSYTAAGANTNTVPFK